MRRTVFGAVTLLAMLPIAACGGAIRSGGTPAPGPDFGARTFAWANPDEFIVGDARLRDSRFFESRLHEAVEWELSVRGIRYDASSPGLLVHHHLALAGHPLAEEAGGGSGAARSDVPPYEDATLVVHLVDAETGGDVWVGWAQAGIEEALRSPEDMRRWVYRLVHRMFEDWEPPIFIEGTTVRGPVPPAWTGRKRTS